MTRQLRVLGDFIERLNASAAEAVIARREFALGRRSRDEMQAMWESRLRLLDDYIAALKAALAEEPADYLSLALESAVDLRAYAQTQLTELG